MAATGSYVVLKYANVEQFGSTTSFRYGQIISDAGTVAYAQAKGVVLQNIDSAVLPNVDLHGV